MESIDFTGLAARAVAGLHEVRACLLASRDGLTLAALPEGGEELARRALDRLETVGQPERGFLVIGDEVWVVSRRGPYLGIVVAAATAKAGLLLDRLESTLRAAEEARLLAGSAGPGRPEIPRRPRTPLHREPRTEPTRSEMKPPNPLFEEVARVVSVPEREAREASVGEASATTAWPSVIQEPEAPDVGGTGSGAEPPTIFRPGVGREREEPTVVAPEPEPEDAKAATPEPAPEPEAATSEPALEREPEEPKLAQTSEPEAEESVGVAPAPEHAPEEPQILALEPEFFAAKMEPEQESPNEIAPESLPAALNVDSPISEPEASIVEPELDAMELGSMQTEPMHDLPKGEPIEAEEMRPEAAPEPALEITPMPRLAHPEVEPPKPTPHYSPPEALLGEMGRVVAGETSPTDILPPGVSPAEMTVASADATEEEAAEAAGTKKPERSKERGEDTEVDPVALAREFSQLFDEPERNS